MQLSTHTKKKKLLQNCLQQLYAVAQDMELKNQAKNIKQDIAFLNDEKFELVVVGEFSRGKSTFVNAMLGRRILPSSVKPTTAIISKIIYGDIPKYFIHYKNKQVEELLEEQFFKITAKDNVPQEYIDSIDFAEIMYPLSFCKDNVEVVDTPGTNDLNLGRMEITYGYLNRADAVILLLSATQALSSSEVSFLKERILGNHIENIFFIISHKDKLSTKEEERQVINFVQKNLKELLPELSLNKRIFLVSGKQALLYRRVENGEKLSAKTMLNMPASLKDTGFIELETELAHFLTEEKGRAKLRKYVQHNKSVIKDIMKDIGLRLNLVNHSADDLKAQVAKLEPEFKKAKYNVKQIIQNMRMNLEQTCIEIENKCVIASDNFCKVAKETVDNYNDEVTEDSIKKSIIKAVTMEQKKFIDELQKVEQNYLIEQHKLAQKKLQKIWDDIDTEYKQIFYLPTVTKESKNKTDLSLNIEDELTDEEKNTLIKWGIGGGIGVLLAGAPILPVVAILGIGAWFLGLFNKDKGIKEQIKNQVVKHYTKTGEKLQKEAVKQYQEQINKVCKFIENMANERIEDMENQLNIVIVEKEAKERDAENERRILTDKQKFVMKINDNLNELVI